MRVAIIAALCAAFFTSSPVCAASNSSDQKVELYYEVARLVAAGDFGGVADLAERDAQAKSRFSDGTWRVGIVYSMFSGVLKDRLHSQSQWDAAIEKIRAVAKDHASAWLLYEEALNARAWQIRGGSMGGDVLPDAWEPFKRYLGEARDAMDAHKAQLQRIPTWYSLRLTLATETGEPDQVQTAIFEEGVKAWPTYQPLYFSRVRQLAPQWGGRGKTDRIRDFLAAVAQSPSAMQEGMYARVVWFAEEQGVYLLHRPWIDKEAMRKSEEAIVAAYPDQLNIQKMFWFACELSDKATATKIAADLDGSPIRDLWRTNIGTYHSCKAWVDGAIPAFMLRDHTQTPVKEILIQ